MLSNYLDKDRHYHNMSHVAGMLSRLPEMVRVYGHLIKHLNPLIHAIIWHDAVYRAGAMDNEFQSAEAGAQHYNGTPNELIAFEQIVMATCHTGQELKTIEEKIIVDLDLCELGMNWDVFIANTYNIRREFFRVPDEQWVAGRCDWAKKMLSLPHLYHTELYRLRFEDQARRNLREMIDTLSAS